MNRSLFLSRVITLSLFFAGALLFAVHPSAMAVQVQDINEDGSILLENGSNVTLAGIETLPESVALMKVLLKARDVKIEYDAADLDPLLADDGQVGYVYVTTLEMEMPFAAGAQPEEKTVLVNRMLLALGAARMSDHLAEPWRSDFEQVQAAARRSGEGIWSYASLEPGTVSV